MNFSLAQRIHVKDAPGFWAVPGNGFVCLVSQERDRSVDQVCASVYVAMTHGLASVSIREPDVKLPAHRRIVGIAPDGAIGIRIVTAGVTTVSGVAGNVFSLADENPQPPEELTPFN
jgi:hypothetical protein